MTQNSKNAFYVEMLMSPEFERVLVAEPEVSLHRLTNEVPDEAVLSLIGRAHGYQIGAARDELPVHWHSSSELLRHMPNLLVVSSNGAGYDTIDVDACTQAGVLAVNQAGGNREAVAEHVLGFMLALTKRIGETDRFMRRSPNILRNNFKGHDLIGRTVGIVGFGHVGSRIAELCRVAFRMQVLTYDPYLTAEQIGAHGAQKVELDELLSKSDYVSVNCPLTQETRRIIGAREFALMQPHAYFINTARGFIHDETALAEALHEQRIAGAGLDVWDKEPPEPGHPLLAFDNVLVSPHTGGVTIESRDNIARIAGEQMLAIFDGAKPPRLLNPEVWRAYRTRYLRIMGREAAA